jgi:hypothetical protein
LNGESRLREKSSIKEEGQKVNKGAVIGLAILFLNNIGSQWLIYCKNTVLPNQYSNSVRISERQL